MMAAHFRGIAVSPNHPPPSPARGARFTYPLALLAAVLTALLAYPMAGTIDPANVVMLFLLMVFVVALRLGRGPALLSALVGVALFDFFFVPPRFSFEVAHVQYLITFAVMLTVAVMTTHLVTQQKRHAEDVERRQSRTLALYELARQIAGTTTSGQVAEIVRGYMDGVLGAQCSLWLATRDGGLAAPGEDWPLGDERLAQRVHARGESVERIGMSGHGEALVCLPLDAPMARRGVIMVALPTARLTEERHLLTTIASLVAIAIERLHYVEVARETELAMASERLRGSVLAALSHDLRTPLTALVGMADTLAMAEPKLPAPHAETAAALRTRAKRLATMVGDLLDLARLTIGERPLRREWQPLEEVIGSAIQLLGDALAEHPLEIDLPDDLPLLEFDAVLLERVICNLLDNAAKHTPRGTPIRLDARVADGEARVTIRDRGPGFPALPTLAEPFVRGHPESATPGAGLGLAICKTIVGAHGGALKLENAADGGARVCFSLPLGAPPSIEEESVEAGEAPA